AGSIRLCRARDKLGDEVSELRHFAVQDPPSADQAGYSKRSSAVWPQPIRPQWCLPDVETVSYGHRGSTSFASASVAQDLCICDTQPILAAVSIHGSSCGVDSRV